MNDRHAQEILDLVERIESVIEAIDDVTFTMLREASATSRERPSWDRTLVQARRALEKAARLLGNVDEVDRITEL